VISVFCANIRLARIDQRGEWGRTLERVLLKPRKGSDSINLLAYFIFSEPFNLSYMIEKYPLCRKAFVVDMLRA